MFQTDWMEVQFFINEDLEYKWAIVGYFTEHNFHKITFLFPAVWCLAVGTPSPSSVKPRRGLALVFCLTLNSQREMKRNYYQVIECTLSFVANFRSC